MKDSRDILDIASLTSPTCGTASAPPRKRPFLSIWFRCCHVYGRLYRNASQTSYKGGCPRCGTQAHVLVRSDGTTRRCFQAVR